MSPIIILRASVISTPIKIKYFGWDHMFYETFHRLWLAKMLSVIIACLSILSTSTLCTKAYAFELNQRTAGMSQTQQPHESGIFGHFSFSDRAGCSSSNDNHRRFSTRQGAIQSGVSKRPGGGFIFGLKVPLGSKKLIATPSPSLGLWSSNSGITILRLSASPDASCY